MKKILLTFFMLAIVFASQYVPIPKQLPGILIGNPNADVKIDLIYDPACDDSAEFDVEFQAVWANLSSELRDRISVRFIPLTLPYHIAAQKLSQAIVYVQQQKGNQEAVTLFRDFLNNVHKNEQANIKNETINGFLNRTAQRVNQLFGLKVEDVLKELAHGSTSGNQAKNWSKYIMGSLRVSGTPTVQINGVKIDGAVQMTPEQLTNLIRSLLV